MDNKTRDAVLSTIDEGIPEADLVFLHGDYHPTNVIWDDNNIKGVTDWSLSHVGPVGLELGHCRINLVCMYGLEVANYFLEAYRQIGHEDSRDDKLQARCDAIRC